jgi:hypothetical protein
VSRTRGPVITERISAQTESWGSGGQLLARRLMAHVMARARSASCRRNHGRSKCPPARPMMWSG